MQARVRVALIKADFTWEEVFINAGGANWTQVIANAEIKVRLNHQVKGSLTYADAFETVPGSRILAVKAIEGWAHTVEEAGNRG